jgi:large subunit ribosomal protein L6
VLERRSHQRKHKAFHGLYRSLLQNMVVGVSEGYKKTLELVGVGYKASVKNNVLELSLGYSHGICFFLPEEITADAEMVKGKNPLIHLNGIDKQLVGQVAAKLRTLRKVEPYKGKGVRFLGEQVRRKAGKSTAK